MRGMNEGARARAAAASLSAVSAGIIAALLLGVSIVTGPNPGPGFPTVATGTVKVGRNHPTAPTSTVHVTPTSPTVGSPTAAIQGGAALGIASTVAGVVATPTSQGPTATSTRSNQGSPESKGTTTILKGKKGHSKHLAILQLQGIGLPTTLTPSAFVGPLRPTKSGHGPTLKEGAGPKATPQKAHEIKTPSKPEHVGKGRLKHESRGAKHEGGRGHSHGRHRHLGHRH